MLLQQSPHISFLKIAAKDTQLQKLINIVGVAQQPHLHVIAISFRQCAAANSTIFLEVCTPSHVGVGRPTHRRYWDSGFHYLV